MSPRPDGYWYLLPKYSYKYACTGKTSSLSVNNKRFYRTFIPFKNIHVLQIQFNTHTNRADKFEMSIIIKVHTVSIKIFRLLPRALMSPVFDTTLFHFVQLFIKSPKQSLGDLLFLLRFLLLFLLLLFFFLSAKHALVHGRSQELQDKISWHLVEL